MTWRGTAGVVVWAFVATSCSRDPNVVKRKYLESGNRYFQAGKYKEASLMYRNALKKDLRFGEAYYRLGLAELRLGRSEDAARALTRAAELQPRNIDARIRLGDLYLKAYRRLPRGDYLDNIDALQRELLRLDARSAAAFRLKGYLSLLRDKNYKRAFAAFQRADEITPHRPEVLFPLAQTLFLDGRSEEAEKVGRELIRQEKKFTPIYDLLLVHFVNTRRYGDAENLLKEKIANNPGQAEFVVQLAQFYYGVNQREKIDAVLSRLDSAGFAGGNGHAGDFYLRTRDYDKSIHYFRRGIETDPKNKTVYQNRIARALVAQGKEEEASRQVDEILKQSPDDPQAQSLHASLLISSGNPERIQQAINELQTLVARMPESAPLRFDLARAFYKKAEIGQARTQLLEAVKLDPAYAAPRLMLADLALTNREYASVLQEVKEVLRADPRNLQAKLYRVKALAGVGRYAEAHEELQAAIKDQPSAKEPAIEMAALYVSEKKYKEAENLLQKLRRADPSDPRGLLGLTEVYAAQGQIGRGIQLLKTEIGKNPGQTDLRSALGNLEAREGQFDAAIAEFRSLLEKQPKSGDLYLRLGEVYRRKGDSAAAIENFRKARELNPSDLRPYLPLALLLDGTGRREEARSAYEDVLKREPDNAVALNNLAYLLADTGEDLNRALTLAQQAKKSLPLDPNIDDTLGWIYIRKNLTENAIQLYRDLVARQPEVSTYRYHFGLALSQKGDKPQAMRELGLALQKKPPKDEENKIRQLIGEL